MNQTATKSVAVGIYTEICPQGSPMGEGGAKRRMRARRIKTTHLEIKTTSTHPT